MSPTRSRCSPSACTQRAIAPRRRDEIDGGLACRDAMLFDGGHSVNFFAAGDDKRISVEGDPVPVFVFATRHEESDDPQAK